MRLPLISQRCECAAARRHGGRWNKLTGHTSTIASGRRFLLRKCVSRRCRSRVVDVWRLNSTVPQTIAFVIVVVVGSFILLFSRCQRRSSTGVLVSRQLLTRLDTGVAISFRPTAEIMSCIQQLKLYATSGRRFAFTMIRYAGSRRRGVRRNKRDWQRDISSLPNPPVASISKSTAVSITPRIYVKPKKLWLLYCQEIYL